MSGALLLTMLTLGGVGLYLAMPGGRLNYGRAALVVLAGAAALLVALVLPLLGAAGQRVWFALLAVVGLWGAVRVITHRRPVYSALYFVLVVIAVAGMLLLLQAEFLAAALIIIYAGAILVTYVFVIMLAQQAGGPAGYDRRAREPLAGVLAGFILLGALATRLANAAGEGMNAAAETDGGVGTVMNVGTELLTHYVVGVEVTGLLLLVAMVGAIAIARRRPEPSEEGEVA